MEVIWSTLRHVHISDQFGNEELVRNEPELYSSSSLLGYLLMLPAAAGGGGFFFISFQTCPVYIERKKKKFFFFYFLYHLLLLLVVRFLCADSLSTEMLLPTSFFSVESCFSLPREEN